jgi:cytochrome P450
VLPAGSRCSLRCRARFPLPIRVICELLGVPDAERDKFREWSGLIVAKATAEAQERANRELAAYLAEPADSKRMAPGEDLLSDLVRVSEDGDRLSAAEVVSMASLLLVAGHETTVTLIANAVLALLRNPGQLAALRAAPGLLPGAVEEFLRFEGPVNLAALRFTTDPVAVGEVV